VPDPASELVGLAGKIRVGVVHHLRLPRGDLLNDRHELFQVALMLGAEEEGEDSIEHDAIVQSGRLTGQGKAATMSRQCRRVPQEFVPYAPPRRVSRSWRSPDASARESKSSSARNCFP